MTLSHNIEELTRRIIGAALEVHKYLGPGLLESNYEDAMGWELLDGGIAYRIQPLLPVTYKGHRLRGCYRPDIIVEETVIVEVKAVERVVAIHHAQVLTYMKHGNIKVGLLFNSIQQSSLTE